MLNLLGDVWEDAKGKPNWPAILAMPGATCISTANTRRGAGGRWAM